MLHLCLFVVWRWVSVYWWFWSGCCFAGNCGCCAGDDILVGGLGG